MISPYNPKSPDFFTRIEAAIQKQRFWYPHLQLRDLYKSFFQDAFGPGHLLGRVEDAVVALERELASIESQGNYRFEPCGIGANFYRLPLDLILDEQVSKEAYIEHFIASGRTFVLPSVSLWRKSWQAIVPIIASVAFDLVNFKSDEAFIERLLTSGEYEASHSAAFHKHYHPHYRIFSLQEARSLIPEL